MRYHDFLGRKWRIRNTLTCNASHCTSIIKMSAFVFKKLRNRLKTLSDHRNICRYHKYVSIGINSKLLNKFLKCSRHIPFIYRTDKTNYISILRRNPFRIRSNGYKLRTTQCFCDLGRCI